MSNPFNSLEARKASAKRGGEKKWLQAGVRYSEAMAADPEHVYGEYDINVLHRYITYTLELMEANDAKT